MSKRLPRLSLHIHNEHFLSIHHSSHYSYFIALVKGRYYQRRIFRYIHIRTYFFSPWLKFKHEWQTWFGSPLIIYGRIDSRPSISQSEQQWKSVDGIWKLRIKEAQNVHEHFLWWHEYIYFWTSFWTAKAWISCHFPQPISHFLMLFHWDAIRNMRVDPVESTPLLHSFWM